MPLAFEEQEEEEEEEEECVHSPDENVCREASHGYLGVVEGLVVPLKAI